MTRSPGYVSRGLNAQKKINRQPREPLTSTKKISSGALILTSPQVVYLIPLFKQQEQ